MGISAAAFVILIAITGLLLNHTEDFAFDRHHVQAGWVLDWYGIDPPEDLHSYRAGDRQVTLVEDRLYLNRTAFEGNYHGLRGAAYIDGIFVIAVDDGILLATPLGEIIEHLQGTDRVPADIEQIGVDTSGVLIAQTGMKHYKADSDFIDWAPWEGDPATIQWAQATVVGSELKASLQRRFRNEILPVERVLLDLHSGRFFGWLGPWVSDVAASLLISLPLSGPGIWLKRIA